MHTQKIAITMPTDLVAVIDGISRLKGMSRSGFISAVLKEKIALEKEKQVKNEYDRGLSCRKDLLNDSKLNTVIVAAITSTMKFGELPGSIF
jgi:metal-responsive CopG/Arc/MetJ family transcriptional regulator